MSLYIRYAPGSMGGGGGGGSGVTTIGTIDTQTASTDGAVIVGSTLYMQSASLTDPGLVNNTTQSFSGNKTFSGTISAANLSGTNTGDVTLAAFGSTPNANGLSLSGQVLNLQPADATHSGGLSSTDWNTFNNKQPAGSYITALTGDGTATGPGSVPFTLATVNGNVGSFTVSSVTVNAKGLVTAASSGTTGNLTDAGTDGITVTGGTGAVLGSGTSLSQHVADTTHNGYLSSTDWNTFNTASGQVNAGPSALLYVDQNHPGVYTPDGSVLRPFVTISAALTQIITNNNGKNYTILVAPGTYSENLTMNNAAFTRLAIVGQSIVDGNMANDSIPITSLTGNIVSNATNDNLKALIINGIDIQGNIDFTGGSNGTTFLQYGGTIANCTIYSTGAPALNFVNASQVILQNVGTAIQSGGGGVTITNVSSCLIYSTFLNLGAIAITTNNGANKPSGFTNTGVQTSFGNRLGTVALDSGSSLTQRFNRNSGVLTSSGTVTSVNCSWVSGITLNAGSMSSFGDSFVSYPTLSGGTFSSTSELVGTFITSSTVPATAGILRLSNTDSIDWRNNANSGNVALAKDTSDQLSWNGTSFLSSSGVLLAAAFPILTGDITTPGASLVTTAAATQNNITSIPNLAIVGTITTGTWNATPITPPFGGSSPVTRVLYVDGNRTDTYTATGAQTLPFKTIQAAINQVITNADNSTHEYTLQIAPFGYAENLTFNSANLYNITLNCYGSPANGLQNTTVTTVTSNATNTHLATLAFIGMTFGGNVNLTGDVTGTNFGSSQILFKNCTFNNSSSTFTLNNVNNVNLYDSQIQGSSSTCNFTNVAFGYIALLEGITNNTTINLVDNPGGNIPAQYSGNYLLFSNTKMYGTLNIDAGSEADFVETYTGSSSSIVNNGTIHSWVVNWGGTVTLNSGSTLRSRGDTFHAAPTVNAGATFLYQDTGYNDTYVSNKLKLTGATSGTISILPQAVAGTFNFNMPTTAGTSGQVLTSAGGGGSPMTWTSASSFGITSLTGDVTGTGPGATATTVAAIQGTTVSGTTGTTNVVFSSAPTMTNPIVGTQTASDNSTKAASTAYVTTAISNAISGVNPAIAVQAATTSAGNTSTFTYNNGVSGIGATLTGPVNTVITIDGYTFTAVGQRLLVKNDTQSPSGAFNGIYFVSALQTVGTGLIFTRALDYDTPSDMNNTGAIPVVNGTVNTTTSWVLTSQITTVGTDPLTFTEFTRNPADYLLKANNLSDVASPSTSFNNISPMTTLGDTIYGGTAGAGTRLAGNTTATLQALTQTGTGSVSAAPVWTSAVSTSTASTLVFRDASSNFSAGTITASLNGNATTATTATNATNVATTQVSNNASYFPLMAASSTNSNQAADLGTGLTFNPSTNTLTTTTFSGNATTATTATNATNVATTATNATNASFFPTFVASSSSSNQGIDTATGLSFNPSTNTLTTTTFSGALSGNATTATTATNATNVATTATNATNASFFPTFVASSSSSNQGVDTATGLSFNPSTNTLTTTTFSGALSGNATTATTATTATNANNVATTQVSNNASYFPLMVSSSTNSNQAADLGTGLTFNPSTNALTTTTFVGALTGNATNVTGTVAIGNGGTGQTTKTAGFDALSPMTTGGDIIYGGASGTGTRLANGSAGQFLKSNGTTTAPSWAAVTVTNSVTSKTANYTILNTDYLVTGDASGGSFTLTLPTAVGISGQVFIIKRTDQTLGNTLTLATTSSQTIDGVTTRKLMTQYEQFTVESDGSNWQITAHSYPSGYVSYTPTFGTGWGTTTNVDFYWKRVGDSIVIKGYFTSGTETAATANITIPTNLTVDSTKFANAYNVGFAAVNASHSSTTGVIAGGNFTGSSTNISFGSVSVAGALTPTNASSLTINSGETIGFVTAPIPITNWES